MLEHLRQIAIFAKTVELGSFRNAAKALNLSPSVVSHHIAQLENQLNVALLYRSTRKISLTSDGEDLYRSACEMVIAAEKFFATASAQISLIGKLRVTLPAVMSQSSLINKIADFAVDHPNVQLDLDFSDTRRDIIRDGFDLAIRMGRLADSNLRAKKLYTLERSVVAAPSYLKAKPRPKTPKAFDSWDWIDFSPIGARRVFRRREGSKVSIKIQPQISVNNAYALLQLAVAGTGLAALPNPITESYIKQGKLERVLPKWTIDPIGLFAVWPANAPKDGLTARLVSWISTPHTEA